MCIGIDGYMNTTYLSSPREDFFSEQWGHRNSGAASSACMTSSSRWTLTAADVAYAAVIWLWDPDGVKATVEGLVSLVAAAGVEKADQGSDGVGLLEVISEVETLVSCEMRGIGEAAVSNGTPSSPSTEQGSPL
jgi:hypothetical protein